MNLNIGDSVCISVKSIYDKFGAVLGYCHIHVENDEHDNPYYYDIWTKVKIENETSENAIMTTGFQCAIIDCAVELVGVDVWDLFRYIKTDVTIDGWSEED